MINDEQLARYIVGIDLGTTNSAVAYVDLIHKKANVNDFPVLQIVAPGERQELNLLPSFHYESVESEFPPDSLKMPWNDSDTRFVTGMFARDHGAQIPGRLVTSAKSWLSHSGVDRTAPILPWHAVPEIEKISPVDASSRYLAHVRQAWDFAHPEDPLDQQDVIITVPASFDEIARELTVEAAARAGLPRIILLEEPQAAFYAWISSHVSDWQQRVQVGQKILICDIGGGTTDFTLIEVRNSDKGVQFHRVAVGDHLILGGDNLDLALAYFIERHKLNGRSLTPRQFGVLVRSCQFAKEILLGPNPPEMITINIPGTGSSLIGGSLQTEVTHQEANEILLNGFFPDVALAERPSVRQSGFQEFGLPYAPDPSVTKYMAAFLTSHRQTITETTNSIDPARPDLVLFNGGVLASTAIRERILEVLSRWFTKEDARSWSPEVLENKRPELAVARGAAYFGLARKGIGVRIASGLARSYYIGVETESGMQALCLAPAGLQEGQNVDLTSCKFDLLIRQPVEFPLYVSSIRTTDQSGVMVLIDPLEMYSLPPIRTVLKSGKKLEAGVVTVYLHARLTEIGTLDLWCSEIDGNRSWKLQFDVRSATRTDLAAHEATGEAAGVIDNETVEQCHNLIVETFNPSLQKRIEPQELVKRLEVIIGLDRLQWPPSLLRAIWENVFEQEKARSIDPSYETRWYNLLGFALRPGYGVAVDDWRVKQTWLIFQKGIIHSRNQACRAEWWVLWRRIAGGLSAGQQKALAQPLLSAIRILSTYSEDKRRVKSKPEELKYGAHEQGEMWRLLASLEHLGVTIKTELGERALKLVRKQDQLSEAAVWAIGRLGARVPLYGPLNELVDIETIEIWTDSLMKIAKTNQTLFFALVQLCRRTNDRYRDVNESTRVKIVEFLKQKDAPKRWLDLVVEGGQLGDEEQQIAFGEQLPRGLRMI